MLPISICIPVRNEEKNLPACLASLAGHFDDIVVVDSGSSDDTLKIASEAGVTILDFKWNGIFPKKRNWALRNHTFKHPWILFLDADERTTPAFLGELEGKLDSGVNGFWLKYDNWFMGRKLLQGDTMRKLALFKIGHGEYEKFPEDHWSHLDMEIHEHPVLDGPTGEIQALLEHHDFRGLESYIAKHNEYSTWESKRFQWLHSAEASAQDWAALNSRQRFKYRHLNNWWLGSFYFLISYVQKKGFLDGAEGFRFAKMKKRYFEEIRLKIIEARSAR